MGHTEALEAYINSYNGALDGFKFGVDIKPVKPTVEMIASDPSLNFLLVTEAAQHYESLIEPQMHYTEDGQDKVNMDDVRDVVGTYMALPIDKEIRVFKIQQMVDLMRKNDVSVSVETTPRVMTNGVASLVTQESR